MSKDWKPWPKQEKALQRREFEILYGGAKAGGKSDCGRVWLVDPEYIYNSDYQFLVVRKNAKDLSEWTEKARELYKPLGAQFSRMAPQIRVPSGAKGWIGHLKDKDSVDHYLGNEYHKILIEELTLIPSEEYYLKLRSCARSSNPDLKPQLFCTTNPGGPGHIWVKNRWIKHGENKPYFDPIDETWRIFIPANVYDNPSVGPEYAKQLEGLPEKEKQAYLYGNWDIFEGQYFDNWSEKDHVYEPFPIPKSWPRFMGIDWGYSHFFCALWGAVGPDNQVYIYREMYKNKMTDSEYAGMIKGLSVYPDGTEEKYSYVVGDPISFWNKNPELGIQRVETYWANGVNITKGNNDRIQGWGRIREYLELREYGDKDVPWLRISKDCPNLIRTLPALVHHDKKPEDVSDGMEDHAPDALRIMLMARAPEYPNRYNRKMTNLEAAEAQMKREQRIKNM